MDSLQGTREAPGRQEEESVPRKPLEEDPVLRTPGRPQKGIWTPGRHQASRKGPFGQPARHQGGTREAGKD